MSNHWHLIAWPTEDRQLSRFMHWLTVTHTQRWHAWHQTAGTGPLYQGRFKAIPIQSDHHLLVACRYVERNPLRANLVDRAEDWRWSSLWRRLHGEGDGMLHPWPVAIPDAWIEDVNRPQTEAELVSIRTAIRRGAPFGQEEWREQTAKALGLESALRRRGRPKKGSGVFFGKEPVSALFP